VLRPWPADDGLLARLRLPGGRITSSALAGLMDVAEHHGDGRIHVTVRANLQVRGMPADDGRLPDVVLAAVEATGLLPSREHDVARNVMASPQTGLAGGRADLRPVIAALDRAICDREELAGLPGRFLFVLDDGRGDLVGQPCDLGLVALDQHTAQLRVGDGWGPVVALAEAHRHVADLAARFIRARGDGPNARWHVSELTFPLVAPKPADVALPPVRAPLPHGPVPGGTHHRVPAEGLDRSAVDQLCTAAPELVVTPWRGVLIPEENP
jgi:precorrin-3B synthase